MKKKIETMDKNKIRKLREDLRNLQFSILKILYYYLSSDLPP